jgi:hypothetical protein
MKTLREFLRKRDEKKREERAERVRRIAKQQRQGMHEELDETATHEVVWDDGKKRRACRSERDADLFKKSIENHGYEGNVEIRKLDETSRAKTIAYLDAVQKRDARKWQGVEGDDPTEWRRKRERGVARAYRRLGVQEDELKEAHSPEQARRSRRYHEIMADHERKMAGSGYDRFDKDSYSRGDDKPLRVSERLRKRERAIAAAKRLERTR